MQDQKKGSTKLIHLWYNFNAKRGEKHLFIELSKLGVQLRVSRFSHLAMEKVIYTDGLFAETVSRNLTLRSERYLRMVNWFIERAACNHSVSLQVLDLFKPYLERLYSKPYFVFEDEDVQVIKQLLWCTKYIQNKNLDRIDLEKDEFGLIKALTGCDDEYIAFMAEPKTTVSAKLITNICGFKDSRIGLYPYEEWVNFVDMYELVDRNLLAEPLLLNVIRESATVPLPAHKRFELSKMFAPIIREKVYAQVQE